MLWIYVDSYFIYSTLTYLCGTRFSIIWYCVVFLPAFGWWSLQTLFFFTLLLPLGARLPVLGPFHIIRIMWRGFRNRHIFLTANAWGLYCKPSEEDPASCNLNCAKYFYSDDRYSIPGRDTNPPWQSVPPISFRKWALYHQATTAGLLQTLVKIWFFKLVS